MLGHRVVGGLIVLCHSYVGNSNTRGVGGGGVGGGRDPGMLVAY